MVSREVEEAKPDKFHRKAVPTDTVERDARLEKVAKRVFVGAGARVLFYPTLLYNVVRNKLQSEFRWWDQIDEFLLLGAVPFPRDVYRLKELGVEAVVTLNEAYETLVPTSMYQDKGINHLVIPTRDYLFAPSFDDIRNAVEFIHEHVKSGKTTYVHCKAGRGRSTTIVLCYLVEHKGMTPVGAYEYVRLKRPRVLLATSQWQAVKEYNERIHGNCKTLIAPGSSLPLQCPVPLALSQRALTPDEGDRSFCYDDSVVFVTSADLDGYSSSDDACLVDTAYGVDQVLLCIWMSLYANEVTVEMLNKHCMSLQAVNGNGFIEDMSRVLYAATMEDL